MGELGIILAILCGVWVYAIITDPNMEPGKVPLFASAVTFLLFVGAIASGIAEALI